MYIGSCNSSWHFESNMNVMHTHTLIQTRYIIRVCQFLCMGYTILYIRGTIAMEQWIKDIISIVLFSYTLIQWTWSICTAQGIGEPTVRSYFGYALNRWLLCYACVFMYTFIHIHVCTTIRSWTVYVLLQIECSRTDQRAHNE